MTPETRDMLNMPGWPRGKVNRLAEHATPIEALREALNVDILNDGKAQRRPGYQLVEAGDWHSLWSDDTLAYMLGVKNGDLVLATQSGTVASLASYIGANEVSYTAMAGKAYWTNGSFSGCVWQDQINRPWALDTPPPPTQVSDYEAGGLVAGEYQICATFQDDMGMESGAGQSVLCTLSNVGGILCQGLPEIPAEWRYNIYVTDTNGDVFYLAAQLKPGTTSYIIGKSGRSRQLETRWLNPLPNGQLVASGGGRLFVAHGAVLRWSEPLRGGLSRLDKNYTRYPAHIDAIGVVGLGEQASGVYVCAGKRTYFMPGSDPSNWQQRVAFPSGAVRGTATKVRAGLFGADYQGFGMLWVSTDGGYCLGLPDGQVVALTEAQYVTPIADSGRVALRRAPGLEQAIALLRGTAVNSLAFSDSVVAEVNDYGVSTDS